jgi:metal-responsive CopG/Arc/MetJ family transcriptional regulator
MEQVCIRLEGDFLNAIERIMKRHRYSTKTEFIREAVREKLKELEREDLIKNASRLFGSSKHKTRDEELHKAGEKAFEQLEKKFKKNQ